MGKFKNFLLRTFELSCRLLPFKKKAVLFKSFNGQYNDNPKYISIKLHEIDPKIKQYWIIGNRCHEIKYLPSYIKKVKTDSFRSSYIKARCSIVVDNGAGWYLSYSTNRHRFYSFLKDKKQFNLSTWHGTPFKKIGADSLENNGWEKENLFTTSDCLICGSSFISSAFNSAFCGKTNNLLIGTPRNDYLFHYGDATVKINLRHKLELPLDKKIVLFAPTYRNNVEDSGLRQIEMFDINVLLTSFSSKFGGEWVIVFRSHNLVLDSLQKTSLLDNEVFFDGNIGDDMMEYMLASDAMITDYSGALFDICLTSMPCFLFAHDTERYISLERGSYFKLSELPFRMNTSFKMLIDSVLSFDFDKDIQNKELFLKHIGNVEDGKASLNCSLIIQEKMNSK